MERYQAWENFVKTGSVEDYIKYSAAKQENIPENSPVEGDKSNDPNYHSRNYYSGKGLQG